MQVAGKTALVTGGASGLGKAVVERLLTDGARVAVLDRSLDGVRDLSASEPERLLLFDGNVAEESPVRVAIESAVNAWGSLDICVHCAGIGGVMPTIGPDGPHDLAFFRDMVDVNLVGTFNVTRLAADAMAKGEPDEETGERGVIITTTSIAGLEGQAGMLAYSASKAGIIGMTLPLTRDLSEHGIRVMAIAPGLFLTGLTEPLPKDFMDYLVGLNEFPKKAGEPAQFASLVTEIISNTYMNGEVIRLDAGTRAPPRIEGWE